MRGKPVIPRALTRQDVEEAINYYLSEDVGHARQMHADNLEGINENSTRRCRNF